jgi:hypothetical protein
MLTIASAWAGSAVALRSNCALYISL